MADPAPGGLRVSQTSYDYVRPVWDAIGCMVIGRHLFDITNGWEGDPRRVTTWSWCRTGPSPRAGTRRRRTTSSTTWPPRSPTARELAGDRTVSVAAGDVGGQALALGLVDEVAMDVVPVVFGTGKRYFGSVDSQHLLDDPDVVVQGDRVLHLRFRVRR